MIKLVVLLGLAVLSASQPSLWPMPQSVVNGSSISLPIQPSQFQFSCTTQCSSAVQSAFSRYMGFIFFANAVEDLEFVALKNSQAGSITVLNVSVKNQGVPLGLGVDESYTLNIDEYGNSNLNANTDWGALRGLETFSQLVNWNPTTGEYSVDVAPVSIVDSPRFQWRGLLIDSARHYLPIPDILRQLDAMSFNKMNVLHWHLTDDQSNPIDSTTFPALSEGAWAPNAIYTHDDLLMVINYAHDRGIWVVPEFDFPAHCHSYGKGYPDLLVTCPGDYQLINPIADFTYSFLQNFLGEMSGLFFDGYMHLGSDEVGYDCWSSNDTITTWMKEHNIASYTQLQSYFEGNAQNIVSSFGKTTILWEESFDHNMTLLNDTIIHVWLSNDELFKVVKAGRRGILSAPYYLDREDPGSETFWAWIDTWVDFYIADPIGNASLTPAEVSLVLGGEACMWGEGVDSYVIDGRIWPRALGFSERMWSAQNVNDPELAKPRLMEHRCRLVRRGISAGPTNPDYCHTGKNVYYNHYKYYLDYYNH